MAVNKEVAFYCRVKNIMPYWLIDEVKNNAGVFTPSEACVTVYADGTTNSLTDFKPTARQISERSWIGFKPCEGDRFIYGMYYGEWVRTYRIIEYSATPLITRFDYTKYFLDQLKTLKAKHKKLKDDAISHLKTRRSKNNGC